ncbi:hypothetical protein Fmac_012220 [Flemingia macrophylla]|uniref:Uncharacterized protein n=1 Tax=Flemingia macrophylla TaxID=520843 RepID=A0ABD1MPQ1_9FABA
MSATECFESIKLRLGSVDNRYIEAFSICLVPEQLRKRRVEAYGPQVVSIGPLHKGTNTDLLGMEEIKWRCMLHLLQRSKGSDSAAINQVLLECTKAMLKLDEVVRASYNVDEVRFNRNDLAKIMLVDGCFLLELLICGSPHLDARLPAGPGLSPGAENKKNDCEVDIDSKEDLKISHPKQRLQRCATKLEAAGVTIAIQSTPAKSTRFDLKVTFENGKLTIPQLHITRTTEAKWRNLIAWELNKSSIQKQRGIKQDGFSAIFISYACFLRSLICCVHDVKLLRKRGVIFVHQMDTDKGKKNKVRNEDLVYLFQNLTRGVPGGEIDMDSWFASVIQKLNSYPTTQDRAICNIIYHATRTSKTMWHIFISYPESFWYFLKAGFLKVKSFFSTNWELRPVGTIIAIVALILTLAQTVFSVPGL